MFKVGKRSCLGSVVEDEVACQNFGFLKTRGEGLVFKPRPCLSSIST